jgi:hypothetical protein
LEGWSGLQVSTVLYGKFHSLVIKILSISPVLPWFQGGCGREWLRTKDNRYKMETKVASFFPVFS